MATRRLKAVLDVDDRATGPLRRFGGVITALGATAAFVGAVQIGRKLVNGIQAAIEASAQQEKAEKVLAASLAATGQSTSALLPKLKAQASAYQNLTGIGDEVILQNQALLVSVGRLSGDGLDRATEAALNLAAGLGVDTRTAFDLVAKAASGYTSTLSRYGIIIDKATPESEKFGAALTQIEEKFGGQAQAQLNTYVGRLAEFQGRVGDLKEAIGGPFREVLTEVFSTVLSPAVNNLTTAANESDSLRASIINLGIGAAETAIAIKRFGGDIRETFSTVLAPLIALTDQVKTKYDEIELPVDETDEYEGSLGLLIRRLEELRDSEAPEAAGRVASGLREIPDAARDAQDSLIELVTLINGQKDALTEGALLGQVVVTEFWAEYPNIVGAALDTTLELHDAHVDAWIENERRRVQESIKAAEAEERAKRRAIYSIARESVRFLSFVFGNSKGVAYASAIVNTAEGVTKALAAAPPPYNLILAAITAAAGAAEIATIASTNFTPTVGYREGGIIPGPNLLRDSVPILAQPGEAILPRDLTNFLLSAASGAGGGEIVLRLEEGIVAERLTEGVRAGRVRLEASALAGARNRA